MDKHRAENSEPRQTWDEKTAALEALFRNLPSSKSDGRLGIPYETTIPAIARELMLMSPIPRENTGQAKKGNKKELDSLARSIERTINSLEGLSDTAIDALGFRRTALQQLKTNLRVLEECTRNVQKGILGAPKKIQPQKIAQVVARHYLLLTGKRPTVIVSEGTAGGPFPNLLASIYEILDVRASAESQAKMLVLTKEFSRQILEN